MQDSEQKKSYWQNLYEGYKFAFKSHYLRAFVVTSVVMMVLLALTQFEILRQLETEYSGNETQIKDFLANITLIGSIILLPFQLLVFNRLVAWAGVETVNLIFPSTSLITVILLAALPWMNTDAAFTIGATTLTLLIGIVAFAEFNRTILNIGIRAINDEFLYNAVPVRVKGAYTRFYQWHC